MKRIIATVILAIQLAGCALTPVTVPIDSTSLGNDAATVIVFTKTVDTYTLHIDGVPVETVVSERPIKLAVDPGYHKLWVRHAVTLDRVTGENFEAGKTYYFEVRNQTTILPGLVTSRVVRTYAIDSYTAKMYHPEKVGATSTPVGKPTPKNDPSITYGPMNPDNYK